jgi:outer membrane beta-barrel protein
VESRIRHLSLSRRVLLLAWCIAAYANAGWGAEPMNIDTEQVIQPRVERRTISEPQIESEDFEVGLFAGLMSVEDFGVNPAYAIRAAYHISEDFFAEAAVGQSKTSKTSYERLSGAAQLITNSERLLRYYELSMGYNLLPGEVFVNGKYAFNTALYLIGGIGSTHFAGNDRFTISIGSGYRFLATDWLAIHGDLRDHIFDMDLFGANRITHNIEISLGATLFF